MSNRDPVDVAAGNLSKFLERFSWITYNARQHHVNSMKKLRGIENLNMEIMASAIALYIKLLDDTDADDRTNLLEEGAIFLQKIKTTNLSSTHKKQGTDQDFYDSLTHPIFTNQGKGVTAQRTEHVLIKLKITMYLYLQIIIGHFW